LILTTPNRTLYGPSVIWETEAPPGHFWWFSERSLELLGRAAGAETSFVDFGPYQNAHPLFVPANPGAQPVRAPYLSEALEPTAHARALRSRGRTGKLLSMVKRNDFVQRLRGKRRVTGARRAVLCAIMRRSAGGDGSC
jgi:hypothetical protein